MREFLHIDDLAEASVFVMNMNGEMQDNHLLSYPQPCFLNVGTGKDISIKNLSMMIKK
jgi:GDP-L-fucose synthase